jgi:cytochrome c oxidase cbb3-type subunit III
MNNRLAFAIAAILTLAVLTLFGCDRLPGRPDAREEVVRPDQVLDFNVLYKDNCSGCHGADGKGGASIALRDPIYLIVADDTAIRNVTAGGVSHTQMPAFAQSKGGMLTDKQIAVLVRGIRAWQRADVSYDALPPYSAPPGDPQHGADVYAMFCTTCHKGKRASPIADPTYLSLVSDQYLRTIIIAGHPELPGWRVNIAGRPMSSDEISDVVAWLASQRRTSK